MGLKISFFGSSLISSYRNAVVPYYRGIIKALYKNGHQITFYEPDTYNREENRNINDPGWAKSILFQPKKSALLEALAIGSKADLIVKTSGVGFFDRELEKKVLQIRRPGQMVVFWDMDAPATLDRLEKNPKDPFIKLIPEYDLIFTYGGGQAVVNAYKELGAKDCIPVYNAVDPETHFPSIPDPIYDCDMAFIGNRLTDRQTRVDEFFFQAASLLPEKSFFIAGNGWDDKFQRENIKHKGDLPINFNNALNSTPLTVLNISNEIIDRFGVSPETRIFEAAGAGACIITDNLNEIDLFFEPGKEILVAASGKEVALILDELAPAVAKKIGQASLRRVLSDHTYAQRARKIEHVLNYKPNKNYLALR